MGAIAAWLGFTLPSAIALVAFATLSGSIDLSRAGWVHGLQIAAVAVVAQAVWSMARTLTPDWQRRAVAGLATAVALLWTSPFSQVAIIAGGAVAGRLLLLPPPVHQTAPEPSRISRRIGTICLVAFVALLVGLPLARTVASSQALALFEAFYRSGSLVFGGGHVVLPLLNSAVVSLGWVSPTEFLAGYGATQAVPGPLFCFAAYLGDVVHIPPNGVVGATIALVAIFLPSFLLIWGALPFWDGLRGSPSFGRALAGTNAAVVGILLAALYTPIWTSAIVAPVDLAVALAALLLLVVGRVPPIVVVALAAAAGQAMGT